MTPKRVAILGTGMVGQTLAKGFLKHGYDVVMGTKRTDKKIDWKGAINTAPEITSFEKAAESSDILMLVVKGTAAEETVTSIAPYSAGKIVMDATNPITDLPPDNGVLRFFTTHDLSLMERLQKLAPNAYFVKAFSCVGAALMVNPEFEGGRPSMFICGDNDPAKKEVSSLLYTFGWEVEDMGGAEAARAIEPLCMLWCIPGFRENRWSHAFKLLKK